MSVLFHNHLLGTEGVEIEQATDYIGFSFNGVHSSELGIKRTSEGSRFNENLLPVIQDKTVQVPGGDGMYFFGSYYTQRQFNVSFAFDSMTEYQLAQFKRLFGDKKIHTLIFDEMPFKSYQAKVTGSATIKHIPFSEGVTNRVYKGEGSITFTAYYPYAKSVYKYLDQYTNSNKNEWAEAANLLDTQGDFDVLSGNAINLYNPGVKDADFILTFNFQSGKIPAGGINIGADYQLNFSEITAIGADTCIKINSKLNLIEGYNGTTKTGNIYNRYITNGEFFKIPVSTEKTAPIQLIIDQENSLQNCFNSIEYSYYYF